MTLSAKARHLLQQRWNAACLEVHIQQLLVQGALGAKQFIERKVMLRRITAGIIDYILLLSAAFAPIILTAIWFPEHMDAPQGQPPTPLMWVTLLWLAFTLLCFFPAFESSRLMATPGKLLMRLKVVRENGGPLSFMQAFYRMALGPLLLRFGPPHIHQMSGGAIVIDR